jgi:methionine biosynthesis protein MetW
MPRNQEKEYVFNYYDTPANEDVVAMVEPNSKVLDIGCSTGRVAERLKKGKNCQVVGIETHPETAEVAKGRCDEVLKLNIESLPNLNFPDGHFDVILFADVLEHCANPLEILTHFKKYLSSGGYLVVSLPNVANWEVRLRVLFGQFDYKGGTLLDDGHLRFFTLKTAKELLSRAGFRIREFTIRNAKLKVLGKIWPTLFGWGFVFKAYKLN